MKLKIAPYLRLLKPSTYLLFILFSLAALCIFFQKPYRNICAQETQDLKSLNEQVTNLYQAGKYEETIPIAKKLLELAENKFGPDHPDTATSLNNLAGLYQSMGDYAKAEPLLQRALKIYEKALGPDHPYTATSLNNLAALYRSMGDYAKA